jgi:Tol biopolymer transport system component
VKSIRFSRRVLRLMLVSMAAVSASQCAREKEAPACGVRFTISPPPGAQFSIRQVPALSPDGSRVAFTASGPDRITRLWVQSLRESNGKPVPGTDEAAFPFWSPDGEHLGFFAQGRLKRVGVATGGPQVLGDAPDAGGGSWSATGNILFSAARGYSGRAIFSVPSSGGAVRQISNVANEPDTVHSWPMFLPDGEHFLYSSVTKGDSGSLRLGSLRSSEQNLLREGINTPVAAVGPGFLLFAGDDVLLRVRFNTKLFEIEQPQTLVAQAVARGASGLASFSASADGSAIVYGRAGSALVWVDAAGRETAAVPEPGSYRHPSLSPSGDEILVTVGAPWLGTIAGTYYVYETKSNRWRRVTDGMGSFGRPLWSADGTEIVFTRDDGAKTQILAVRADGSGVTRKLFDVSRGAYAAAISPRSSLMAIVEDPGLTHDRLQLRVVSLSGGAGLEESTVWRRATAGKAHAPAFSPDGRWLAYVSNETGRDDVFVTRLEPQATPAPVSARGGALPVWAGDGQELFYRTSSGIVAVRTEGPPSAWAGRERLVFRDEDLSRQWYKVDALAVTRDGTRFLMLKSPDPGMAAPLMGLAACRGSNNPVGFP